jgi:Ca2+-binding EF-hand superfamily protein
VFRCGIIDGAGTISRCGRRVASRRRQAQAPDFLIISAHGAFNGNSAGLVIGDEVCLQLGLDNAPPVVMLSACHVAPRGAGAVSITDLLLREGVLTVLGAQIPVRVDRNAMIMARFLANIAGTASAEPSCDPAEAEPPTTAKAQIKPCDRITRIFPGITLISAGGLDWPSDMRLGCRLSPILRRSQVSPPPREGDMAMLSAFRRRKLSAGFNELDVNGDGRVGNSDIESLIKRHGITYGYAEGTPEYDALAQRTKGVWEQIKRFDSSGDGEVTLEEYVAGFAAFLEQRETFMDGMDSLVDAFYALADRDGDGRVDEDELIMHFRAWNHSEEQAREAFRRLDRNRNGGISKEEWMANLEEFYYSEDPQAPGNWLAPLPPV